MNFLKCILVFLILSSPAIAEESASSTTPGFISDDLFIYMHSGAGNNYRIIGTINSGTEIQITGLSKNEYSEIIDDKGRVTWVESKYVSTNPGLRNVIAELNGKLANASENISSLENQGSSSNNKIASLSQENTDLKNQIATLNSQLTETNSKLKDQDTNIKKEWFFNGAIVLGLGLLFGLLLPKLVGRKKASMESWS